MSKKEETAAENLQEQEQTATATAEEAPEAPKPETETKTLTYATLDELAEQYNAAVQQLGEGETLTASPATRNTTTGKWSMILTITKN